MFENRKLLTWKCKLRKIVSNIHSSYEFILQNELYSKETCNTLQHKIYFLYKILDQMNNSKYLKLYKRVYFYYIYNKLVDLFQSCGSSSLNDLCLYYNLNHGDKDNQCILKHFRIYKTEIVSQSPELDEEFNMQFKERKFFFWNSYPANTRTVIEQLHGAKYFAPLNVTKYVVFYGIFEENALLYNLSHKYVQQKQIFNDEFTKRYMMMLSLKDYLVNDKTLFENMLQNAAKELKRLQSKSINDLQREMEKLNILKQRKNIILLLCSSIEDDRLKAKILYDSFHTIFMPFYSQYYLNDAQTIVRNKIKNFDNIQETNYKEKIVLLKTSDHVKQKAFEKLRDVNSGREISSKAQHYLDGLLRIPFGRYIEEPIFKELSLIKSIADTDVPYNQLRNTLTTAESLAQLEEFDENKKIYMHHVQNTLNNCVHGHKEAKQHIERLVGQWIHGKMKGTVFGLQGPPGTGKTTLAKNGFARCLIDNDGNTRPIAFLPIGGSSGSAFLEGHGYTYMGSTWGRIVDILMEQKCMNPIIYIDELDKIGMTERGQEINGILIHLTDPSQNTEFTDKYFSGIKFDLSQAIIIFSYNDSSKIDRILRDRITEIHMNPLSRKDKLIITHEYIIPEILSDIGLSSIICDNDIINFIIDVYTNEAGVRKLKEILYTVYREINIQCLKKQIELPFNLTTEFIKILLLENAKNMYTCIEEFPMIGKVNGLFANSEGTGGITVIEVHNTPAEHSLSLTLTGNQGDVMKESMKCAKTLAWNLLTDEEKDKLLLSGLHIHCPMGATPKDGPSAGCAITTAIYSRMTQKYVKNDVAMTGEIDLDGNIHAIGGLEAKLFGALRAKVKTVIIPEKNNDDYNLFKSKYPDFVMNVISVKHIDEIFANALLGEEKK